MNHERIAEGQCGSLLRPFRLSTGESPLVSVRDPAPALPGKRPTGAWNAPDEGAKASPVASPPAALSLDSVAENPKTSSISPQFGKCVWDLSGNCFSCSDGMLRLLGYTREELTYSYRFFMKCVHSEDRQRVKERIREAIHNGHDYDTRHRIIRSGGATLEVKNLGGVTRNRLGAPVLLTMTVIDVTDELRQDDAAQCLPDSLLEAEKLVSLGMLASGIAHEIANPNQSIMSNATFLLESWRSVEPILERYCRESGDFVVGGYEYSEHGDKLPDAIRTVLESSRRVALITEELRCFARRSPDSRMGVINANAVVRSASVLVTNLVRKSTDRFEVAYGRDLPPIRAHFQRMEQVLINLIQNACQALPDRQKGIRVSTSYDARKDAIVISVQDEGIGVDAAHLAHISEPFFTTKWESGGSGLGLWISSNIVLQHGGLMQFDSVVGKGTTVSVILPALSDADS